ncbi:hypothetical protein HaLaN_18256, partial [Haematococcus lacustris]
MLSREAEQRGNLLMACCMAAAHPALHLPGGEAAAQGLLGSEGQDGQLLHQLTAQYGLDVLVVAALQQVHRGVAHVLGRVDEEVKAATRALADEMQWAEYDDEYDDSFDDADAGAGADAGADCEVEALGAGRRRGVGGAMGLT